MAGSSHTVSSDAATQMFAQMFAKVSNFPSWQPKKGHHKISLSFNSKQKPVTPLFSTLGLALGVAAMPCETLQLKRA